MEKQDWRNHPNLKDIDQAKLDIIMALANQTGEKKQNELVPFLLAAAAKSRKDGVTFTPEEIDVVIDVLKEGKSKEEIARMDKMKSMMKMMGKK